MAYNVLESCFFIPEIGQSACASWVQAWGTIAAIWGAIWVSRRQAREARRLEANKRHLDDLLKTEIVQQLFVEARALCAALDNLDQVLTPPPPIYRAISRLDEVEQAFRALPSFELPGLGVATGVLSAPKALKDLTAAANACIEGRVRLMGHPGVDIASRTRVEFQRAHEQASGLCVTGVGVCEQQIHLLRTLMPVQD